MFESHIVTGAALKLGAPLAPGRQPVCPVGYSLLSCICEARHLGRGLESWPGLLGELHLGGLLASMALRCSEGSEST